MTDLEDFGYAKKIPNKQTEHPGRVWYIPHNSIVNPKKPKKKKKTVLCSTILQNRKGRHKITNLFKGPMTGFPLNCVLAS